MALLIDGYNLLHASGILGEGGRRGSFERSRSALLKFLAVALEEKERRRTTVVFDAFDPPFGQPRTVEQEGMTIRFAAKDSDADSLIEELIKADTAPKQLTVVSSDRRIQRAARRRKATAAASDAWFTEICRRRNEPKKLPEKPQGPLSRAEIDYWMAEFGGEESGTSKI